MRLFEEKPHLWRAMTHLARSGSDQTASILEKALRGVSPALSMESAEQAEPMNRQIVGAIAGALNPEFSEEIDERFAPRLPKLLDLQPSPVRTQPKPQKPAPELSPFREPKQIKRELQVPLTKAIREALTGKLDRLKQRYGSFQRVPGGSQRISDEIFEVAQQYKVHPDYVASFEPKLRTELEQMRGNELEIQRRETAWKRELKRSLRPEEQEALKRATELVEFQETLKAGEKRDQIEAALNRFFAVVFARPLAKFGSAARAAQLQERELYRSLKRELYGEVERTPKAVVPFAIGEIRPLKVRKPNQN